MFVNCYQHNIRSSGLLHFVPEIELKDSERSQKGSYFPRTASAGVRRRLPPPVVQQNENRHIKQAGDAGS